MQLRAPSFWHRPPGVIAHLLSPLGAIYGAATARRMSQPGTRVEAPVICVGNLTLGGAGKTPTVIALAKMLAAEGRHPFVVSRGYGGSNAGPLRVDPVRHEAGQVGDEPLEIAATAPVIVARDRVAGARLAIAEGADVILLDDGLQNPSLAKTFSFAVIDAESGFGNGLCFPAGPLRAPAPSQLGHVDALIAIGDSELAPAAAGLIEGRLAFRARFKPDDSVTGLENQRVLAFAGIGRPGKFFAMLRGANIDVRKTEEFADHRPYADADLAKLASRAAQGGLIPVTTMKDAQRIGAARAEIVFGGALRIATGQLEFAKPDDVRARIMAAIRR